MIDDNYQYSVEHVNQMEMGQRWIIIHSKAAQGRAEKALKEINKKLKYHIVNVFALNEHKVYEGKGRPKKGAKAKSTEWQITGQYEENPEAIQYAEDQKSCFILATNIADSALSPEDVLHHYKAQSAVERGFRFLKTHYFLFHHFL